MLYPAYIHQDEDGSASGTFPDVPGCLFAGDTLEETVADAKSALEAHFEMLAELGREIPQASGMMSRTGIPDKNYSQGFWYGVMVDLTKFMGKAERINITLPQRLIEKIDTTVNKNPRYSSRSHFLAEAARKELAQY
ncbi:type II toxin-antitoxin system HicB family antitoxin [Nissabacter archeti]|uniref:Type II toxin-antitoxin system HicB family antitoxin n=1 Tax=Nissabacter archeti TaxID=1917880 RepID=A0ABS5JFY2_9GAMM|nr:type II toxin-antitoxin system HicB family antitoxin [Nissabacter archeti]MBS0968857.1 type II toxin-antitoxin system HicB family antitoxin [Nissabacter archeti]